MSIVTKKAWTTTHRQWRRACLARLRDRRWTALAGIVFCSLQACSEPSDGTSPHGAVDASPDGAADGWVESGGGDVAADIHADVSAEAGVDAADSGVDALPDNVTDALDEEAVSEASTDGNAEASAFETIELIRDYRFLQGFKTYPATPTMTPTGALIPPTATTPPIWGLAEWYTTHLLPQGPPTMTALGAQWENATKRVIIRDGFLELAVNADAEYGGVYRQPGQNWPHLLIQQDIFDMANPQANSPIHRFQSVTLELDVELVYAHHVKEAGYDPALHACQYLMYLTLQNRNVNHPDYGNYIWFGLTFYDDRFVTLPESIAYDVGTGKYMFQIASSAFMPASLHDQPKASIHVELLPYLMASVQDAIDKGILHSSDLEDYYLGGMNMGFEVPGRSVATVRVMDFHLRGVRPTNESTP